MAWEGREKVSSERLRQEYSGKRTLRPEERKKRLKPLNDLFSMAECCLIADTVQFFKDNNIPFFPRSCVEDILGVISATHISGDFHRLVASNPEKYFEPKPHLASVLQTLKDSGKKLIFVSNSPFWYVDAGMKHVIGPDWRATWDAVNVSAGKPSFYTDSAKPFREVSSRTGRVKFKKIDQLETGEVYTEGCLRELTRCLKWDTTQETSSSSPVRSRFQAQTNAGISLASPTVLYIGDSLFADLNWSRVALVSALQWASILSKGLVLARLGVSFNSVEGVGFGSGFGVGLQLGVGLVLVLVLVLLLSVGIFSIL